MVEFSKLYWRDAKGSFAIFAAMGLLLLVLVIGIAVDFTRLQGTQTKAQDDVDGAVLAAARYMSDTLLSNDSDAVKQAAAKQIAIDYLQAYAGSHDISLTLEDIVFTGDDVTAIASTESEPYFASLLGISTLDVQVVSTASIAAKLAKDVDVVLIADATGSMAATLTGIQTNMKDFTADLSDDLTNSGIKLGRVRVQFIFYRDYMIDNHKDWTGPEMALSPSLKSFGPMYISPFFDMPAEKMQMDGYVDYFQALGGGSFKESGLEAFWHGLNTDWNSGTTTVRSIVLWTDAVTRPLGDTEEVSLAPHESVGENVENPNWWSNGFWRKVMGNEFADMTKEEREAYMYNTYYPKDMPNTLAGIKSKFDTFHQENSAGIADVKTMAINVVSNCWDEAICSDWPELATWDGIDLTIDPVGVTSTETYDRIVKQVAATVISQVTAKEIVITN